VVTILMSSDGAILLLLLPLISLLSESDQLYGVHSTPPGKRKHANVTLGS